jgi:hypothetical protein
VNETYDAASGAAGKTSMSEGNKRSSVPSGGQDVGKRKKRAMRVSAAAGKSSARERSEQYSEQRRRQDLNE